LKLYRAGSIVSRETIFYERVWLSMEKKIYQVDAFTERCFGGNPAAVVPDANGLDEYQMQKIAREMNLSETAFVFSSEGEGYDYHIRFFTPNQEVDLCGHATIAAFHVLCHEKYIAASSDKKTIKQKTKAGILPVELYFSEAVLESVMMTQASPRFIHQSIDLEELAEVMNINRNNIGLENVSIIPKIVSTGLPDIILPMKTLSALKEIQPKYEKLTAFSNKTGVVGVHAFTLETEEKTSTLACRNFAPAAGINEEAATGTSNGALGAYLVKNNIMSLEETKTIICEQGYYMNRPSKITVRIEGTKDDMTVKVGGKAVIVLEGRIKLT